ncbi:MAG: hypothetical protein ACKVZ6_19515 [Kineosporiaceae bacterium]
MDTELRDRRIGRVAWVMAWVGLVVGQFHAMARHNTADGKSDLDSWTTRVWSDPGRNLFAPLLDWASPDAVYLTYGKIWFPVFAAFTACAFVLYQRRRPRGFEKFAWRFALLAYTWACVAVLVTYWTQWTHTTSLLDLAFLLLDIPGVLLTMIGSTMLGITLLAHGFRPRTTGWLLALAVPLSILIGMFTSMGSGALAEMFGFGIAGLQLARRPDTSAPRHDAERVLPAR